jgi:hypothetical protein
MIPAVTVLPRSISLSPTVLKSSGGTSVGRKAENMSRNKSVVGLITFSLLSICSIAAQESVPQKSDLKPATEPVITNELLPANSKLYVAPMSNGFETYVVAGLQKKRVPLIVVTDHSKADFELTGVSESDKAGWAKMLFLGSQQSHEIASVKVVNLTTGNVVFAYSVNKGNSARGKQRAGEAVAKHINEKIENRYH